MRNMRQMILTASLLAVPHVVQADDWPRFRGPDGLAVSLDEGVPLTWSDGKNIAWKVNLPGPGSSSPIVTGDRIFVTCYAGYGVDRSNPGDERQLVRSLVCVSLRDGALLWQKAVPATLPEDPYGGMLAEHGYASHTPATDGQRVFVFFGKCGVLAFDLEGHELWRTAVGTGTDFMRMGSGSSLSVYKNLLIVNASTEGQAILGLDAATGTQAWKTETKGYGSSQSTPVIVSISKQVEVVVNLQGEIWGLDPKDGGLFWYSNALGGAANTTAVAQNGVIYVLGGGPGGSGAAAIRAGGSGDVTKSGLVWQKSVGSYVPSPIVLADYLYWVDDKGTAYCLKADSGAQVYRERLSGLAGGGGRGRSSPVYASMVAANGRLYVVSRHNGTFVLAQRAKFEILAHNEIESDTSDFNASPAVVQGRLLLRSNQALYCIGDGFAGASRATNPVIQSK